MKKLFILIGLFLMCFLVSFGTAVVTAQEWVTANQSTVAWDAVTTLSNGDPIPKGDTVEYAVYLVNAITDPDKTSPTEIGTVNATEYIVTLNVEGHYFVGLKAVRKRPDGTAVGESVVVWSDDPAIVLEGHTFGLRYFLPPANPGGLRPGS